MLVGLVSAKGSPGVTTTALALASVWPRTALVLDADPFGGDVRAGLGGGDWPGSAGLAEAVADLRVVGIDEALRRRAHQPAPWAPPVLAGLGCVGQATALPWRRIGSELGGLHDADVVADCGRFAVADGVDDLLKCCNAVVLVTRSSLRAVRAASRVAPLLGQALGIPPGDPRLSVLVVASDEPYAAHEVAQACRTTLLGEVTDDPRGASVWSDGDRPGRWFRRSPLQRDAKRLAVKLTDLDARQWGAA
ncbi:hypothetical protein [Pseudonocardia hydrocarbonoxydans]|uniref:hypothetical protein n=1 Tax=Pseudonocardia hydrocarbonoxydans TaxID=76726 RepID=UPI0031E125E9